jgi:two-component system, cell cycle sensor histidine kinase and response regulator CckA
LVMDDEEAICMLMIDLLTGLGYEVEPARDGAEAIALYEAALSSGNGFAAVLLDVTVPGGMGGIEAARRLREIDPRATLIVSSGYSQASVMSEFRKYGFDAMVQKPWTLGEISQVFQQVLSREPGRTPG